MQRKKKNWTRKIQKKVSVKKRKNPKTEKKSPVKPKRRRNSDDDDYNDTPVKKRRRVATTRKSPRKSPRKSKKREDSPDSESYETPKISRKQQTELQQIENLKKLIRNCGIRVQGITKDMSNTKVIQRLRKVIYENEKEGMKEKMTKKGNSKI